VDARQDAPTHRILWGWCGFVLFWTSVVLFLGANVTTTESGDASPEWPTSWGGAWYMQLDELPAKLATELSHRFGVPILGVFCLALLAGIFLRRLGPGARKLGWAVLALLVVQAGLGGLRVLEWKFPYSAESIAVIHAVLAQIFFCTLVGLLAMLSPARAAVPTRPLDADGIALIRRAGFALALLFAQLVLGALGRHDVIPREVHAMFALVVVPVLVRLVLTLVGDLPRDLGYLRRPGSVLAALTAAQVALGIWTYLERPHVDTIGYPPLLQVLPINLHLAFGAWLLGTSLLVLIRAIDVYGLPTDERVAPLIAEARGAA